METKTQKITIQLIALFVIIGGAIWLTLTAAESELVQHAVARFGYLGIFAVSAISGFNLLVPIPVITFFSVFLAAGLNFWIVIVVISVGMTTGDAVGYLVGNTGRALIADPGNSKVLQLIERFQARHTLWPYVLLFLYAAFAPAPNEIIVIPMAFAGYQLRRMFPIILAGNLIFNTLAAYGVTSVFGLL